MAVPRTIFLIVFFSRSCQKERRTGIIEQEIEPCKGLKTFNPLPSWNDSKTGHRGKVMVNLHAIKASSPFSAVFDKNRNEN
ncbi:MAG: hypothetical protein HQL43_10295 [Alphaproteobacteria bacterium]|nr:hypothetical protein [Alphaproteobacteria bacterium]